MKDVGEATGGPEDAIRRDRHPQSHYHNLEKLPGQCARIAGGPSIAIASTIWEATSEVST